MIPTDLIDKLEHTWRATSEFCATLTEAQWKTPSQLPGWSVQDLLSHLVGTERALEGLESTTHRAPEVDYIRNPIGAANENEVDARRHLPGAEVLKEWNDIAKVRLNTLRNGDDAYFDTPAMTPTGPGTRADFLHIRVLDCWLHDQDMRRVLGISGNAGGPAAEHTMDRLIRTIPIVVGKRAATPEGKTVAFVVTGAVQRQLVCTVSDGRANVVPGTDPDALATLTMDSDTFFQLATGRATADELKGKWTASGDADHAYKVASQFNMMI